ncbi:MAG: Asp-tRNA(Asn)/Glu-tRNA(Gln) amidotransferase subunit GatA, partial [Eubacterium sp.]|nr:Asp-tRNA(Asn)/Glu-tRNA(Gln) amidotransferase subunit GatA [Eubacterium sp.]
MDILKLTALELGAKIRQREITPTQALNAVYTAAKNDKYNCYISLDIEPALELATEVEKRINSGEALSPLAGVPIAVKDNICT